MNKLYYFKAAFAFGAVGITTFLIVKGLFDVVMRSWQALGYLLLKSVAVGVTTGLVLGVLNMYFKLLPGDKTKKG
jgi:hypothetical protein